MKGVSITDPTTGKSSVVKVYEDNIVIEENIFNIPKGYDLGKYFKEHPDYIFKKVDLYSDNLSEYERVKMMVSKNKSMLNLIKEFDLCTNSLTT